MADIGAWVAARAGAYPPKHPLSAALTCFTNQRTALMRFVDDAALPLDNNAAVRALRLSPRRAHPRLATRRHARRAHAVELDPVATSSGRPSREIRGRSYGLAERRQCQPNYKGTIYLIARTQNVAAARYALCYGPFDEKTSAKEASDSSA